MLPFSFNSRSGGVGRSSSNSTRSSGINSNTVSNLLIVVITLSLLHSFVSFVSLVRVGHSSSSSSTAEFTGADSEHQHQQQPLKFAGGSPTGFPRGSCWCGPDEYCMCTPSLAIDLVIQVVDNDSKNQDQQQSKQELDDHLSFLLVARKDGMGDATMGGFVTVGESSEDAACRELFEETGLTIQKSDLRLLGAYTEPDRDPRRHTGKLNN
jgi:hypothetical protein